MVHGPAVRMLLLGIALLGVVFAETKSPGVALQSMDALYASAVVSMHAAVAPNPDNTLAAQLAAKEAELLKREAALSGVVRKGDTGAPSADPTARYALILSSLCAVLVVAHWAYDIRRSRFAVRSPGSVVNLRTS
jgi:hypothetical protein